MTFQVIAGPCSLENCEMAITTARFLKSLGVETMRASIFKMRTCPKSWRGLETEGVDVLKTLKESFPDLKLVCEVRSLEDFELVTEWIDVIQIGTRNSQNFYLIEKLSERLATSQTLLLKRGMGMTVKEFRDAQHYAADPNKVWLCERGIRTFEKATRNTLDISAVPVLKSENKNTKVFIDPSHSSGEAAYIPPLILAAKAVGADGVIVEIHPEPQRARTDSQQALDFKTFELTMEKLSHVPHFTYENTTSVSW